MVSYIIFWQKLSKTTLVQKFESKNWACVCCDYQQKRFLRFKKRQKVDCLQFVYWISLVVFTKERHRYRCQTNQFLRRLCDSSRELDSKQYHILEFTQKLFQGHFKGFRRILQILMRKIKLQKGLMMGARSKIESSKEAKQSLKKHILDFQDYVFFFLFERPRYRVWEFCNCGKSSQASSMISKILQVFCHKPHIPVLFFEAFQEFGCIFKEKSQMKNILPATDYGRPMKPFFIEIQTFWAWADKLGR